MPRMRQGISGGFTAPKWTVFEVHKLLVIASLLILGGVALALLKRRSA